MRKLQGFTLIELMIMVKIIDVLATIAIHTYQTYVIRAKVTEVLTFTSTAKTMISESYLVNPSKVRESKFRIQYAEKTI